MKAIEKQGLVSSDQRRRPTIGSVLASGLGLLIVLAVGLTLWLSIAVARDNLLRMMLGTAEMVLQSMVEQVRQNLAGAEHQTAFLADLIGRGEIDPVDETRMMDVLLGSLAAAPEIVGIGFVAADLHVLAVGRDGENFERIDESWRGDERVAGWIAKSEAHGAPIWLGETRFGPEGFLALIRAHPVYLEDRFLGATISAVSVEALSQFLERIDEQTEINHFILAGTEQVVAHRNLLAERQDPTAEHPAAVPATGFPSLETLGDPVLAHIWDPQVEQLPDVIGAKNLEAFLVEGDDERLVFIYDEIEDFGLETWYFGLYAPESQVEAPLKDLRWALVVGLVILGLAVALSLAMSRAIARPIERLASASASVRDLNIAGAKPVPATIFRETDNAAVAYNAMLGALRWFETYVPRSLALQLMRQAGAGVASEQREVSVFFTDIAGFTSLSSRLSPDDLAKLLNHHFAILAEGIEAEGGTIDKYIGDSVMAFWGAPEQQADHAARACRAALTAGAALEADNVARVAAGLEPIRVRIGIHSGTAVVGNIGAPGRINYTLIGDTVNAAQRLEALGKAHMEDAASYIALISGETKAALEASGQAPAFQMTFLGDELLRGRSEATAVYRLTA